MNGPITAIWRSEQLPDDPELPLVVLDVAALVALPEAVFTDAALLALVFDELPHAVTDASAAPMTSAVTNLALVLLQPLRLAI